MVKLWKIHIIHLEKTDIGLTQVILTRLVCPAMIFTIKCQFQNGCIVPFWIQFWTRRIIELRSSSSLDSSDCVITGNDV